MSTRSHINATRWFFIILAAAIVYLFWRIIEPSAVALLTAAIFAILLAPVHTWLSRHVKGKRFSVLVIVFGVFLLVAVPLFIASVLVVQQATEIVDQSIGDDGWIQAFDLSTHPVFLQLPAVVQEKVLSIDLIELSNQLADWVVKNLGAALSGTAQMVIGTFIFFIALYYFLIDRDKIHALALELSPFKDSLDDKILRRIVKTVRSVVFGALIIAIVQGILAALGMSIFGVPGALLWGALAVVAAQVPTLGIGLIMVPAIAYLLVTGDTGAALGLTIWAVVVVGFIDNLLSPLIIGTKTKMNELLILVSILGGLQLVGPIGFIVGPTILAALMVMVELYRSGILNTRK